MTIQVPHRRYKGITCNIHDNQIVLKKGLVAGEKTKT